MRGVERRAQLLSLVREHLVAHGMIDLSLSELARQIGSNNRMLLYYFGSLDALLAEAVDAIMESGVMTSRLALLVGGEDQLDRRLDAAWRFIAEPDREPQLRIFFARFGTAVDKPAGHVEFFERTRDDWVDVVEQALVGEGYGEPLRDRAVAIVALWRGLQVALLSGEPWATIDHVQRDSVHRLLAG